jgi:hypothetical protein
MRVRGYLIVTVAMSLGVFLVEGRGALAAIARLRAAASMCQELPQSNGVAAAVPVAGNAIGTDQFVGRFQSAQNFRMQLYCPLIDLPTAVDLTNVSIADRVSVILSTQSSTTAAAAQLCSDDNSGFSIGGSCDAAVLAPIGTGVHAIDITMSSTTNWQINGNALHYIYVFVPAGPAGFGNELFSGYTIWHT